MKCDEKQYVFSVFLLSLLTVVFPVNGAVLSVGSGETYSSIQSAIDASTPYDTILVGPGTYNESPTINKPLIIESTGGPTLTSIVLQSGTTYVSALHISASGVVLKGFTITGFDAAGTGLASTNITLATGISNIEISNNIILVGNCGSGTNGDDGFGLLTYYTETDFIDGLNVHDNVFKPVGTQGTRAFYINTGVKGFVFANNEVTGRFAGLAITQAENGLVTNNRIVGVARSAGLGVWGYPDPTVWGHTVFSDNTISETATAVAIYDAENIVIQGNILTSNDNGVFVHSYGLSFDPATISINRNNISNCSSYGVITDASGVISAQSNWWGAPDGPSGAGPGSGSAVSLNVSYTPWLAADLFSNILKLSVQGDPAYVKPGETVVVDMDVKSLAQHVIGCQAILNFSSTYFNAGPGEVDVQAGGGIWNELIWKQWNASGDLDVAVGVDLQSPVGTKADGTIAKFTLTARNVDGTTRMVFRPDVNDIRNTMFSDLSAQPIYPGSKIDSQTIVIDGTPPVLTGLSAIQQQGGSAVNVLDCANQALRGTVRITVDASDALSGLSGIPAISVSGPESLTCVLIDSVGPVYGWETIIDSSTANGSYAITITALDRAGNEKVVTGGLCINKSEAVGTLAMDTWSGATYSFTREVVFKATDSQGSVLKIWTVSVLFTNDGTQKIASGTYALKNVPDTATGLSAKTNWTLRRKIAVVWGVDSLCTADFTGSNDLLGGDLDWNNMTNFVDYLILRDNWFTHHSIADINGDGTVNLLDFLVLRSNWYMRGSAE